jgi:hypothetical protein
MMAAENEALRNFDQMSEDADMEYMADAEIDQRVASLGFITDL